MYFYFSKLLATVMHPSKPATQNFCFKKRQLVLENSQEILLAFKALVARDFKKQFFPRLKPCT